MLREIVAKGVDTLLVRLPHVDGLKFHGVEISLLSPKLANLKLKGGPTPNHIVAENGVVTLQNGKTSPAAVQPDIDLTVPDVPVAGPSTPRARNVTMKSPQKRMFIDLTGDEEYEDNPRDDAAA